MAVTKQFTQLDPINNGITAADNFKLSDVVPAQHTDLTGGVNKLVHRTLAQSLCEPVAVCNSNNPSNGAYTANCSNYPDFALSYQDTQQNTYYLIGLKIRVIFTYGITYGSVSGGTYPTLNINGSGAIPMLAQGKTMAAGAATAGQTLEFTVIPYGNGIAFDADSNVRESTSDYTIYTDGTNKGVYKVINEEITTGSTYGEFRINHYLNCSKQPVALVIKEGATPYFFTINAHHTVSGKYVGTTFIVLKEDGTRAKGVTINVSVLFATS